MFAINHAATGLIIKKIYPDVPMAVILVSVQLIEIFWVALNFLGVEKTTTENNVSSVSDVHLEFMPFSHSVASTVVLAAGAWTIIVLGFKEINVATAVALGICSHLVLDLISHARDIAIAPFLDDKKIGLGLYEKPAVAFVFETIYGIFCWWIYGGGRALFWTILLFNLANASFFLKAIPGPERFLAHRPLWITAVVALQIVVTAVLVGVLS
ncbi:MAG: hypothetical protein WBG50_18880 [Desulfomonilaceae bacterium]